MDKIQAGTGQILYIYIIDIVKFLYDKYVYLQALLKVMRHEKYLFFFYLFYFNIFGRL